MRTLTPQSLGRYQVEAEIGRGAMGVVFRARDPKIDRLVAIKTVSMAGLEPEEEQQYREKFAYEARAAGRLSHPGIVAIFDVGEDPESHEPYLVMEYVAGQPLSRKTSGGNRKVPLETALRFSLEIAEALHYAHAQGVFHGDIKPANILITEGDQAKIADFGIARLNQTLVTQTGPIFGSPAYMAPERLSGKPADASSDLFSLGVMMYSMITGFRPFQGNSAETVCFKVMNVEPVPVTSFQAELPPELDAIIAKAIAKNPEERYQSGAELAHDIRRFLLNDVPGADVTGFFERALRRDSIWDDNKESGPRRSTVLWSASLAVLLLAGSFAASRQFLNLRNAGALEPPPPAVPGPADVPLSPKLTALRKRHSPPKSEVELPPDPQVATLRVEIFHHFNAAKAAIWLDKKLVFDQDLHGDALRHALFRTVEMHQVSQVKVPPGTYRLEVRVASLENGYDQVEELDAVLDAGPAHVLNVNCDKRPMQVTLK